MVRTGGTAQLTPNSFRMSVMIWKTSIQVAMVHLLSGIRMWKGKPALGVGVDTARPSPGPVVLNKSYYYLN